MKRANGTGSIVKLSGNRRRPWAVRIPYHTQRGRVRQRYLPTTPRPATPRPRWMSGAAPTPPLPPRSSTTPLQQVYDLWSSLEYPRLGPASVSSPPGRMGQSLRPGR